MVQAFVLVQTEVGRARAVAQQIEAVDGVVSAEAVVGPYDVIVRADGASDAEVAEIVSRIQKVDAITRTLTCPVAPQPTASVG
ncbi:AsnC family transcriptional regulator [Rhodococcus sp. 14-2483-1-1]|uniref:Lrp/AsnC ligand binding domain-containing protein n=1 Tax=Nocardiaceae TaxID=85025 RepID=UPI00050BFE0A|nr:MULTISPECIES: Lrp/AsnC ligand binding domain-containing protein [Rhodococcus]OZC43290.1 AsnC family transcriptional regulator [Rhodococcus sp. WWJCD1]OZC82210.1 AsnC family transcriptional regulator [Rhodococcus sp. 06-412-2C]OZC95145.1 AsnC family transcriptional regulator [Rhodococcus sp. 06-412-2B]OZE74678.1 AsnC family transcriptional regulator [Rhodococcus sp. 15-649-2-2]OZF30202.1 AsnC family transcriptional regulator [Rhodococcus sp. 14-2483-1-1]